LRPNAQTPLILTLITGVSLEAMQGVTPEIYPSSLHPEKFIIPGIKTDTDLQTVIHELDKVGNPRKQSSLVE